MRAYTSARGWPAGCELCREALRERLELGGDVAISEATDCGLVLGTEQFGFAAQARGVADAYKSLQDRITNLLTGADAEFDKIASALKIAADAYESEDAAGAHTFDQMGR